MLLHHLDKLSEVPLPRDTGDFRVIDRKVINAFNALPENNKYVRGLISWIGFKQTPFYYERNPRYAGATKYTFSKMVRFASTGIFYFSKKPLQIATMFGFASVAAGGLLSVWIFGNKLVNPFYLVSGWTSVMLVVIYFGGVQLLSIGILGHYLGSLFDEIKKRPEYIVHEILPAATVQAPPREIPEPKFLEALATGTSGLDERTAAGRATNNEFTAHSTNLQVR